MKDPSIARKVVKITQGPYLSFFFNLFVFPGLVTLSILHTEKLNCCRNITS